MTASPTDADRSGSAPHRSAIPMRTRLRVHWPIVPIAAGSAVLSSWALGRMGWGNSYYSAAVRSMSTSWRAFFYGSIDSVGFVTVDKPPLSLWVQALVVRVVGFSQMALLVPQVVASVATVVLVYVAVVRRWGRTAASIGAVVMTIAPISVAVAHSNNTDAILTLTMTATAVAGIRAVERAGWRWTIAAGVLFGAAFTTKMLSAAPVLPAVALALVLGGASTWRGRLARGATFSIIAVATGLIWFTIVDLTPADERPYVGSSISNSAYQLAFERNGVNQVEGDAATTGGPTGPTGGMRPGGGALGFASGNPGALRLFNDALGTQIGWFVVPGLLGAAGAALVARRRRPWQEPTVVIPLVWFASGALIYSATRGIVHPYYVASIVPPLAMLIAAGAGAARRAWGRRWVPSMVIAALAATAVASWSIARRSSWNVAEAISIVAVAAIVATAAFVTVTRQRPAPVVAATLLGLTLLAPTAWTVGSLRAGSSANLPYADPVGSGVGTGPMGRPGAGAVDTEVIAYLTDHRGDADWLVATASAMDAAPIIIATGEPVMALGGFSGNDHVVDAAAFDRLVDEGRVRFVSVGGPGPGPGRTSDLIDHVTAVCAPVTEVSASLYDCAG